MNPKTGTRRFKLDAHDTRKADRRRTLDRRQQRQAKAAIRGGGA